MARWKARGQLPIGANWTFLLAITVEALWADIGRNHCAKKGGGSLWTQISGGKGRPQPTIFGIRKLESLGYRMIKKVPKIATRWVGCINVTDRQTDDRQTTDGRAMAYSERERKFTSAKMTTQSRPIFVAVLCWCRPMQYYGRILCQFLCAKLNDSHLLIFCRMLACIFNFD